VDPDTGRIEIISIKEIQKVVVGTNPWLVDSTTWQLGFVCRLFFCLL
jgi:hypothetical protein